jgi:hypothetical protein
MKDVSYQYGIVLEGYKAGGDDARPKSEIVWQAISPTNQAAVGRGVFNPLTDPKIKLEIPTRLSAKVTKINTSNEATGTDVDRPDLAEITISGLDFGYTYRFYLQVYNGGVAVSTWPNVNVGNAIEITPKWRSFVVKPPPATYNSVDPVSYTRFTGLQYRDTEVEVIRPIDNYVDNGSWTVNLVIPVQLNSLLGTGGGPYNLNDYNSAATWTNWQARVVAEITGVVDTNKNYLYTTSPAATSGLTGNQKQLETFNSSLN